MKSFLSYLLLIAIVACKNGTRTDSNSTGAENKENEYSNEDKQFIMKADSICQAIDADNLIERTKEKMITDKDGQQYPSYFKGYAKNHPDSIHKLVTRIIASAQQSAATTFYYYNGTVIKSLFEILADDTVHISLYYNGDKMIYPNEPGMEKAAKEILDKSVSLKTEFLEN